MLQHQQHMKLNAILLIALIIAVISPSVCSQWQHRNSNLAGPQSGNQKAPEGGRFRENFAHSIKNSLPWPASSDVNMKQRNVSARNESARTPGYTQRESDRTSFHPPDFQSAPNLLRDRFLLHDHGNHPNSHHHSGGISENPDRSRPEHWEPNGSRPNSDGQTASTWYGNFSQEGHHHHPHHHARWDPNGDPSHNRNATDGFFAACSAESACSATTAASLNERLAALHACALKHLPELSSGCLAALSLLLAPPTLAAAAAASGGGSEAGSDDLITAPDAGSARRAAGK